MPSHFSDRQIDSADRKISQQILPKIDQLQAGTDFVGQFTAGIIDALSQPQNEPTNGVRRTTTIIIKFGAVLITHFDLILAKSIQQIVERLFGQLEPANGLIERRAQISGRSPLKSLVELSLKFCQTCGGNFRRRRLVRQIVSDSTERVDVKKRLAEPARQQHTGDHEIFIVRLCQTGRQRLTATNIRVGRIGGLAVILGKKFHRSPPIQSAIRMKIILAAPRGFCAGVNMAINSLDLTLQKFGPPVYVYHEIVHNQYVVRTFSEKGAVFVNSIEEIPEGSVVLFSAHGVSPTVRAEARQRKLTALDATCPLVTKVHLEAIKYAKAGFTILLIGHEGHDEVIGTMGEAPEAIVLVEDEAAVDALQIADETKLAYLTQTTLSVDDANRIIARLRQRFPRIESPPKEDICYATQNRQEAVRKLSDQADIVVVLGSQNSSNSQRLRELAADDSKKAYLVDGPADLDASQFSVSDTVLITAGASAPESVVQETISWLVEKFGATVELASIREESVHFPLPKALRAFASEVR